MTLQSFEPENATCIELAHYSNLCYSLQFVKKLMMEVDSEKLGLCRKMSFSTLHLVRIKRDFVDDLDWWLWYRRLVSSSAESHAIVLILLFRQYARL